MSLQSTDQVADLITRIRNAIMVGKNEICVPTSKLKVAVVESLKKNHFLDDAKVEDAKPRGVLHITINRSDEAPRIHEITKISKPGRRIYAGADEIPTIKSGRGIVLVSTSKGIMTGSEAKKNRLGGELILKVY